MRVSKQKKYPKTKFKYFFSLVKLLGNGSNSRVYLGRERSTMQLVAVKKVSKDKIRNNTSNLKNFQVLLLDECNLKNEIWCLKRLKHHKQSADLINVFNEKKHFLMVMSFEGETNLKQFLKANPLLSVLNPLK